MNFSQLLIYFIGELYVIFSVAYCYSKLSFKEIKKYLTLKNVIIIIILSTIMLLNNLYNLETYRTLMSFIIMIFTNFIIFKDNLKTIIINTIIFLIFSSINELIFSPLFLSKFDTIEKLNKSGTLIKFAYTIFIFSISNIFFCLNSKNMVKLFNKIKNFSKKYITLEMLFILIVLILNIMMFVLGNDIGNIMYLMFIIIGLLYILITSIIIIKNKYIITKLNAKNKELTNTYKSYTEALNQFRELKHNLKNDLFSIKSGLPKNKQILINNLIIKYNHKYEWLNQLAEIPEGLEGIIFLKKQEAEREKITFLVNYKSKNIILEKDFLDICDVLGIMLDNAIEASKNTKNKIIIINVKDDNDTIEMKITNTFNNIINLEKIGDKNYSTKKIKSGLGLNYIEKLKNKNISTKMEIVNNLFNTYIYYKIKKKRTMIKKI